MNVNLKYLPKILDNEYSLTFILMRRLYTFKHLASLSMITLSCPSWLYSLVDSSIFLFIVLCFIPKSDLILQQNLETIFELEWWYFLWMWKKWIQTTSIYELKMMDSRVSYLYSLLHLSHTCTRTADSTVTPYWRRNWANMFQAPSQTNLQKCSEDFSYCLPDVFEIIVSKIFF